MKVLREYEGSHHYWDAYEKSDLFCPSCGKKDMWAGEGEGDYYQGVDYICKCGQYHFLDLCGYKNGKIEEKILKQLEAGITDHSTTKRGN